MFLLAILEFRCIECFAYALASLVLIYFYVCTRTPALLYPISFFFVYCFPGIAILPSSPHSCKALLSFVLFTLTLTSLTLLVIPPCPKVVVTTLAFTDNPKFSFFCNIYSACLCCYHSKMKPSTSSYRCSLCAAAMRYSPLYFMNFTTSGPYSFSKFIVYCITCQRNRTGSFSLMSPDISILNSKVSLYPAWAPRGLVSSSVYEILWGI